MADPLIRYNRNSLATRRAEGRMIDTTIGDASPVSMGTSGGGLTGFHKMQNTPSAWEKMQAQSEFDRGAGVKQVKDAPMPEVNQPIQPVAPNPAIPAAPAVTGQAAPPPPKPTGATEGFNLNQWLAGQHKELGLSQTLNPDGTPIATQPTTGSDAAMFSTQPAPPPADTAIYPDAAPAFESGGPPIEPAPAPVSPNGLPKVMSMNIPGIPQTTPQAPAPAYTGPSVASQVNPAPAIPGLPQMPAFQPAQAPPPIAPVQVAFSDPFAPKTMNKSDLLAASVNRWNEVSTDPLDLYRNATTPAARERAARQLMRTQAGQIALTNAENDRGLAMNKEQNRIAIAEQVSRDKAIARQDANTRAADRMNMQAEQNSFVNSLKLHEIQFKDAMDAGASHAAAAQVDHYLKAGVIPSTAAPAFKDILSQPGGHKAANAMTKFYEDQHKEKMEAQQKEKELSRPPTITPLPEQAVVVGGGSSAKIYKPDQARQLTPRVVKMKEMDAKGNEIEVNYVVEPDGNGGYRMTLPTKGGAAPAAGQNAVTLPDGRIKTFPSAEAAEQFRKSARL